MDEKNSGDYSIVDNVNNLKDFIIFMKSLIEEYKEANEDWENLTLEQYLNGIMTFVEYGLKGHYNFFKYPFNPEKPDWQMFARILYCASVHS